MENRKTLVARVVFAFLALTFHTAAYSQASKEVTDHFKALNAHDVKAIVAGYTEDAQMYSPNWEGASTGSKEITTVYSRYFSSTPDLVYSVTHIINAGSEIIVEYTASGILSNPETGTAAYMKDKKYKINYCALLTLRGGKIIKETDYFDQVAFLRQVGFFDQK